MPINISSCIGDTIPQAIRIDTFVIAHCIFKKEITLVKRTA